MSWGRSILEQGNPKKPKRPTAFEMSRKRKVKQLRHWR
jgi:hypothetical protein